MAARALPILPGIYRFSLSFCSNGFPNGTGSTVAGGKVWLGYQDKIQSGHLEHKVTTVNRSDGSEKVVEQVLITAKGIAKISKLPSVTAAA